MLSYGAAVGEGQALDPSLEDLAAIVAYADQHGFGYVALDLVHGQRYELAAAGYADAGEPPPGTTFAVVSVGDLDPHLSFGGVVPGIAHAHPIDEEVGLLLALFGQPEIAKAKQREASNDLMIRFGSARTVATVTDLEQAQDQMRRQLDAWTALAELERGPVAPIELARPYERALAWPLANGAVLVAASAGLHSPDGRRTELSPAQTDATPMAIELGEAGERRPCPGLPDRVDLEDLAIAPTGDALLLPINAYVAQLWTLTEPGCGFTPGDEIRRLDGGALGQPRAVGRTATSEGGRLSWAEAKQRRSRAVGLAGVELRPGALRWVDDEVVVIPAQLRYAESAAARLQAAALAAEHASPEAPAPEPPTVDPATQPEDRAALVFVRLPPANAAVPEDGLSLAVVGLDALAAPDPAAAEAALSVRNVTPLVDPSGDRAGAPLRVAVILDGDAGSSVVELELPGAGPAWHTYHPITFDLAAASADASAAARVRTLATELPAEAHDLVVSPTGRHAAWSAPIGAPAPDAANFELFVLALDAAPEAGPQAGGRPPAREPRRLTDNDRADLGPVFAGPDWTALLFTSSYAAGDELEVIPSVRAIVLEP